MRALNGRKKVEKKYIVLIIILTVTIFIGILSLIIDDKRNLTFPEKIIKDVVVSIEKVIYFPFRFIGDRISEYNDMRKVYKQYKDDINMKEKNNLLNAENKELINEINDLKALLGIKDTYREYKTINAAVVNRNVGDWYNTLTIDKGSLQGIEIDLPVIVNNGLIGRIIKTTNLTSDIKLLSTSDINNKVSVAIINNDKTTYGLLSGYDKKNKLLLIDDVTDDLKIEKGNIVVTSGLSDIYPKDILIGTVDSVVNGEFGISKIINVKPSVDYNNIRYVSILKGSDNK